MPLLIKIFIFHIITFLLSISTIHAADDSIEMSSMGDFSYTENKDTFEANVNLFNYLMRHGIDYLRPLPIHYLLAQSATSAKNYYLRLTQSYIFFGIITIALGFAVSLGITPAPVLIPKNTNFFPTLDLNQTNVLNPNLIFNLPHSNYSINSTLSFIDQEKKNQLENLYRLNHGNNSLKDNYINYYNDPNNYAFNSDFFSGAASITLILATAIYSFFWYTSHLIQFKEYRTFFFDSPRIIIFLKLFFALTLGIISATGQQDHLKKNLQDLNNKANNKSLDSNDQALNVVGGFFHGIGIAIPSTAMSYILISIIFNTIKNGFFATGLSVNFNDNTFKEPFSNVLHYLLDSPTTTNTKKQFILNLLYNKFTTKLNMAKMLQILDYDLLESIHLAGFINHLKRTGKNPYKLTELHSYKYRLILGLAQLISTSAITFFSTKIITDISNTYQVTGVVSEYGYMYDFNRGYIIRPDGVQIPIDSQMPFLAPNLSELPKNQTLNYNNNEMHKKITQIFENTPPSLIVQIGIFVATGFIHSSFYLGYKIYTIMHYRQQFYRGPMPIISLIMALATTVAVAINYIHEFHSGKNLIKANIAIDDRIKKLSSTFGIENVNTRFLIADITITMAYIPAYLVVLPITQAIIFNIYRLIKLGAN